jgi:hypothetical protein
VSTRPNLPDALAGTAWHDRPPGTDAALADLMAGPEPESTAERLARVLRAAPALAVASRDDPDLAARLVAICGSGRALAGIAASLGDGALAPLRASAPRGGGDLDASPVSALRRQVGPGSGDRRSRPHRTHHDACGGPHSAISATAQPGLHSSTSGPARR